MSLRAGDTPPPTTTRATLLAATGMGISLSASLLGNYLAGRGGPTVQPNTFFKNNIWKPGAPSFQKKKASLAGRLEFLTPAILYHRPTPSLSKKSAG